MYFTDRAQIADGRARITPEGYFVADALVGRANNIQEYRAAELGDAFADRAPNDVVRVFRPEGEVFAVDSLKTASRLPITLDHPPGVMVDATNWREFVHGETGEQVMRHGEFIRVPVRVGDATAVAAMGSTHKEFSLGYAADLRIEPGKFGDAEYDASLINIRYNHLAACRVARGGPELRITDERGTPVMPKIVVIDALPVDVSNPDIAEQVVTRLVTARDTAVNALQGVQNEVAARDATIANHEATIATLRDDVANATLTPAQLRDAAGSYARTTAKAKALGATFADDADEGAIKRAAVAARMGDKAAAYTDEQVVLAFDMLDAGTGEPADPLRAALRDGSPPANLADASKAAADARAKRLDRYASAHRPAATA